MLFSNIAINLMLNSRLIFLRPGLSFQISGYGYSEYSFFEILYKHHTVLNSDDLFKAVYV